MICPEGLCDAMQFPKDRNLCWTITGLDLHTDARRIEPMGA